MSVRIKITDEGLLIPKAMLEDVEVVEIRKRSGGLVVYPVLEEDPIFCLGKDPVEDGPSDASVNLDKYIYNGK